MIVDYSFFMWKNYVCVMKNNPNLAQKSYNCRKINLINNVLIKMKKKILKLNLNNISMLKIRIWTNYEEYV